MLTSQHIGFRLLKFFKNLELIGKYSSGSKAYVEGVVCNESELAENSMKVCNLGEDNKVLVIKQNGEINAVGTQCTHYGAPLVAGALGEGRVRCPWHGACFSVKTGDIEDFPGLDSLPCYKVTVGPTGDIHVRAKKNDLEANRRLKDMGCRDISNKSTFVIVGGGGAGECCAETLRQEGFSGRLLMVTNEATPPYDRPKLSKQMDATPDKVQLRPGSFYKEHDIELMLNSRAISICTLSKKLTLENGTHVGFDKIFLCTGSDARHVDLPGSDLGNIFTLRNVADTAQIYKTLTPESEVVIYGTSFIGMEAAAYCVGRVKSVTVVGRSRVPFKASLGEAIGNRLADLFTQKGVKLELGVTISAFSGETNVKECTLSDGRSIPATTVILGLGTVPATNFIVHSQIQLNENGTVPVNEYLETNVPGVFAGGDIAFAPVMANNNQPASIGHWQLAHYHGRIAALNMLGKTTPLETVPYFWTSLFGMSYRYSGYAKKYDDVLIGGSLDDLKFAAYYCDGEDVVAVCTAGTDPIASSFAEKLSQKRKLSKSFINSDLLGWHKNIQ